jgi:hypothetical protein
MRKAWQGDGRFLLPARKVEPYRLWFEFLKLALRDPDIDVDRSIYADWGDVEDASFNEWWAGPTWRKLFAADTFASSVRVIEDRDGIASADDVLLVRIPLNRDPDESIRDIRDLLDEYGAKAIPATPPKFALSSPGNLQQGLLKPQTLASIRLMLRLYKAWLDHSASGNTRRNQNAAIDVYRWAKAWNDKVEQSGWKREKTYLPKHFEAYAVQHIRAQEHRNLIGAAVLSREQQSQISEADDDDAEAVAVGSGRRQVKRWIDKARRLAANVARGEFPGSY